MNLTSQLITDAFPDLDKVEKLNKEAFPKEERVPLIRVLALSGPRRRSLFCLL